MTFLLPAPRAAVLHIAQELAWRFREMLGSFLMRRSGPRHLLRSPRQIRWQRWKVELAVRLHAGPGRDISPYRLKHPREQGFSLRPSPWSTLHPPPRTAQSPAVAEHDDDRTTDLGTAATAYAMPNTEPTREAEFDPEFESGFGPGLGSCGPESAEPEAWPEVSPGPWTEPSSEPWAEAWTGQPEAGFTGHVEDRDFDPPRVALFFTPRAHVERAAGATSVDPVAEFIATCSTTAEPGTAHVEWSAEETASLTPVTDWPDAGESGYAHHAVDTAPAAPEDEEEWEFQVGDLTRWWDEAIARLDALARDEVRDRPW
ncbi:hypothetical protein ACIQMJ_06555 [Actinosynnema sp. NPDC091369]